MKKGKTFLFTYFVLATLPLFSQFTPLREFYSPDLKSGIRAGTSADLDGDGDTDILAVGDNSIAWFENTDGTGSFTPIRPLYRGLSFTPYDIIAGDWDNDGDPDLFVKDFNGFNFVFLEHINGQGLFAAPVAIPCSCNKGRYPRLQDFDQDGNLDLFFVKDEHELVVWKGEGNFNNLSDAQILPVNTEGDLKGYEFGDVDNDGDMDIFVYFEVDLIDELYYYENTGENEFGEPVVIENQPVNGSRIRNIQIEDLNSDGFPELVIDKYATTSTIYIRSYVPAQGDFSDILNLGGPFSSNRDLKIADFDHDGHLDILQAELDEGLLIYLNQGNDLAFSEAQTIEGSEGCKEIQLADINTDGPEDLIVTLGGEKGLVWFESQADPEDIIFNNIHRNPQCYDFCLADLNNDGRTDVISTGYEDNFAYIRYQNNEEYRFPSATPLNGLSYVNSVQLFDPDADGDEDILAASTLSGEGKIILAENTDGQGNFSVLQTLQSEIALEIQPVLYDFDSDGDVDVIFTKREEGTNIRSFYLHENTEGNYSDALLLSQVSDGSYIKNFVILDLDNDEDSDIIYQTSYEVRVLRNDNLSFTQETFHEQPVSPIVVLNFLKTGDINNDGLDDLIFSTSGTTLYGAFYQNESGALAAPQVIGTVLYMATGFEVIDYDSDGDKDMVSTSENHTKFLENDGAGNFTHTQTVFSQFDSQPVFHDVDLDGDLDLLGSKNHYININYNYEDAVRLSGNVFWDENSNGIFDENEESLNNNKVKIEPTEVYAFNQSNGSYSFAVATGNYNVKCIPEGEWTFTTDSLYNVDIDVNSENQVNDFGMVPASDTTYCSLSITSGPTRCGFTVPFRIDYGCYSFERESGLISLELDPLVTYVSAEPVPSFISEEILQWQFSDLLPNESEGINLQFTIAGAEFLGEYIHLESHLVLDETDTLASFPFNSQINCAYDPNDKLVEPNVEDYPNYTLFEEELFYTIRFQNTGTDTAFNVRIEDRLDTKLDYSTFRLISSSHSVTVHIDVDGKTDFLFENILLPSENENQAGSQGFVKYAIRIKENTPEGSYILNQADIYFDFNEPIITNTVNNIGVSELPVTFEISPPSCPESNDGYILLTDTHPDVSNLWNDEINGNGISGLGAGSYHLQSFLRGLPAKDTIFTLLPLSNMSLSVSGNPENDFNQDGNATVAVNDGVPPYSYEWSTNPPQFTQTAVGLSAGEYTIIVTDDLDCSTSAVITIDQLSSAQELENKTSFKLFPNPSSGRINFDVQSAYNTSWDLSISDFQGKIIHRQTIDENTDTTLDYSFEHSSQGIYLIRLSSPFGRLYRKYVVTF